MNLRKKVTTRMAVVVYLVAAFTAGSAWAKTVYVSPTGNDANAGLTWATAKLTVQAGLNTAVSGDEVWVAAGTYVENITLKLGVALYGGFAGGETELSQRNWTTNQSILDGNRIGSVVKAPQGATVSTRIDGFTIRNGGMMPRERGGIYCSGSSPTISNNHIVANFGTGIYCSGSSASIENNHIVGNSAAGIYCAGSSPTVANNSISRNLAGGIHCRENSSPTIVNNTISGNTASAGRGGGIFCADSSPTIVNNTITGNFAALGGGISCYYASATIANTIVAFNSSGIRFDGSGTLTLQHNCLYGNASYDYSGISDPTGSNGNISADPELGAFVYGNMHIQPDSPCVDTGDDSVIQPGWLDIDGQPRIIGTHVDIGADESDGTGWPEGPHVIVRVSPNGDDANDGSSWAAAKRTVQSGIDQVALLGGEVWVQAGTYYECITLHPFVHLYGGFAGTESTHHLRDWVTNMTILNGQQRGRVVTIEAGHRVSTVDGFTIRNGTGGISCSGSSPTIANNHIVANIGGGIYCSASSPMIANNTITGNIRSSSSIRGVGISCTSSSSPTILNNTIIGNGGGIYSDMSSPTIANTIIAFNASGIHSFASALTVRYNCVYGNVAYNYVGMNDPTGTNGNISADPKLASLAYGNMRIQPDSRCIDAGDDSVIQPGWLDIDGESRIIGTHVDIGADESDGTTWPEGPYVIVRVSPDGDDANDGSSWALAKRTVQAGIDTACTLGGEVWVQTGTYDERITVWPFAHVYGGFAGTENTRDSRDWVTNGTILNGQEGGPVVTIRGGCQANTVDGFKITNGTGTYGGVACQSASPTIANNTITGNAGSGISCSSSSPVIANNTIAGNSGRGIFCDSSSATITNNTITANSASGSSPYGGGIYCSSSSPTIANNTITKNTASHGGGIYCDSSSPVIANNTISYNGGGLGGGILCSSSSPTIANNTITGNSGTGVYCSYSSPTITNTIVAFNSSGIGSDSMGTLMLRHNCVFGNLAYDYSGVTDPTGTDGNISIDPKLASVEYGNMHIQPDSPCVDAGDDIAVETGWVDRDGQARIQGLHVDIGADESDETVWSGGPYVIVRVSPQGDDANDGLSWATAKRTVQAGIDAGASLGGEVWVHAGTYYERITVPTLVYLYGGFAGNEDTKDQRDWIANPTILDGEQGGSVVTVSGGYRSSTIDGFTIQNGIGTWASTPLQTYGGGIYCYASSPTIANNTIVRNTVRTAGYGAGIYCRFCSPTISGNIISGNTASSYGGGIYCYSSSPTISNNTITENSAECGGGVYCEKSSPTIANNTISDNKALSSGGGMRCDSSYPTIVNNTIARNVACGSSSFSLGGGIYLNSCSATITNNTINGNMVSGSDGRGGGIYCGSGTVAITNTIIAFNSSGIYNSSGTVMSRYNCAYGNTAYNYSGMADPTGLDGNISSNPKLADSSYGNDHIQPDSSCVDAGDDSVIQPGWLDIDGQSRIIGTHVDIGADESDATVWSAGPDVIVRVSPQGSDANDGSSWAAAKQTVQAGIDAAASRGGEVWVQAGTYYERITLLPFAYVYGGFAGTETTRDSRDWVANETILDGQQGGSVITVEEGYRVSAIDGFTITNGTGTYGAVYCSSSGPTLANNTIIGNSTSGIYCHNSCPTIYGNSITGNAASSGGGIFCYLSSSTITNNTITGNSASGSSGNGGGIFCERSCPTIMNNVISGNTAPSYGGGIYCRWSAATASPIIAENTITGNSGAGIYCDSSSPTIANTIVAFNSSGIRWSTSGTPIWQYNCVFGNTTYDYSGITDPTGIDGNISADPLFVRPASPGSDGEWGTADDDYGDLRLQPDSPCIDAGDNTAVPADTLDLDGDGDVTEPIPFDLAGKLRFFDVPFVTDTGLGTPPIVDMGAYEFVAEPSPDLDGDGDIDAADFDLFLAAFGHRAGEPGYNLMADLDGDGVVTFVDYQQWLQAYRAANESPQAPAPLQVLGDFGLDGHVDTTDLEHFEACATGPGVPQRDAACQDADLDRDDDVDQSDFGLLQRCFSGLGQTVDLSCKY